MYTGFRWGNLRERAHLRDPGIDRRLILRGFFMKRKECGGMDWIELAQDKVSLWALLNAVMNLRVP